VHYVCDACHARLGLDRPVWQCGCGGLLDLSSPGPFADELIDAAEPGLWRYAGALPPVPEAARIRLGETMTPLVPSAALGLNLKLDYLLPSGSFKDRGTAVMTSRLHGFGIRNVVDDSSGNAGASLATYTAAAGIGCEIFTPVGNTPGKLAQIRAAGATLRTVVGGREAAAEAALAAGRQRFYASHKWHPDFLAGVATVGLELYEQMGRRVPSVIIAPCGQGSLILGAARAFAALAAGAGTPVPRLFAVQAEAYPAIASAAGRGLDEPVPNAGPRETIAEGIATARPVRGREILRALRSSGGSAIAVPDRAIGHAAVWLAEHGFYVEPTSAAAVAGLWELRRLGMVPPADPDAVLILTGSGLKAGSQIADLRAAEAAGETGASSGAPAVAAQ
jgi:threonine synthase